METIFDLATSKELAEIFGDALYPGDKTLYDTERRIVHEDRDYDLSLQAALYADRGDDGRAAACLEEIKGEQRRIDTALMLYESENP